MQETISKSNLICVGCLELISKGDSYIDLSRGIAYHPNCYPLTSKPTPEKEITDHRSEVLDLAKEAVTKDRNVDYGEPEDNFSDIAKMWDIYKGNPVGTTSAHDEAVHLMIVKICRIKQSPRKKDHWVDSAGYSACGYQCVMREKDGNKSETI